MKSILNIFLLQSAPLSHGKIQTEMSSASLYIAGVITAFLLLIYLVISLVKPEKF